MRIKNLRIDKFGKLDSVSIGLDDKITVISGKNEAGKSSVATFIKYMLYGFDSTKKADISENQKKKYMPWDGSECSGEIVFTSAEGKKYTAVRKTAARSHNTVFDENNMPVTTDNAGEYFFGINENAYKKTAFIGQKEASFTDEGELDSAIRNMVYSADESVDSAKALKKLDDLRRHFLGKSGRIGLIYEIENELSSLCEERDKWKDGHKELLASEYQLAEIQKKIAFNKQKKDELEKEKENLECFEARKKLEQIDQAKKTVELGKETFEEHYKSMQNGSFVPDGDFVTAIKATLRGLCEQKRTVDECSENLERAKDNLASVYSDETQKNIFATLAAHGKTSEGLLSEINSAIGKKKSAKITAIILTCLIITLPVAIFFYIKASKIAKELSLVAQKYCCDSIETLISKLSQGSSYKNVEEAAKRYLDDAGERLASAKTRLEEIETTLEELAAKGGFDVNDAEEYIKKVSFWLSKTEALKAKCREDYVAYNTLLSNENIEELSEKAKGYDSEIPVRDMKTVLQQLSFYTQANEALIPREREYEKNAAVLSNTLPKPSELQSKILSLTEKLNELKGKHAALSLAVEALEKASESMRSEAAPMIASETSKLFSQITDGKYKALYTDNEMHITFLEEGEAEVRDAGYLSAGTLDAAYISLRVALCKFLYKENPTLVFDDAFANMDNERLARTLDFLAELSEDFQIIILSCHDREKEYLKDKAKIINFEV